MSKHATGRLNFIYNSQIDDRTLNSRKYAQILTEILPLLLEYLPLNVRRSMYQQDGCPAYSARIITELLNRKFGDRWISRSRNKRWAASSPDLTLMDFYLWGKLKQVYSEIPMTRKDMKERIKRACVVIDPNEIRRAMLSIRFRKCVDVQDDHF